MRHWDLLSCHTNWRRWFFGLGWIPYQDEFHLTISIGPVEFWLVRTSGALGK